jgi:CPA2 family monovalent cation:H+ antiporter-2
MAGTADPELFKPALIILGSAGLVIPIVHRLKISPLIGFIVIGIAVGPSGLGLLAHLVPPLGWVTITDVDAIAPIGELGVVMLMFMIGLELSWPRLMLMRRLVFGLGTLQVGVCAAAIAGVALALGMGAGAAVIVGLALAMSSTAVVVQLLSDGNRMAAPVGRACLAVLLFQDLAAVPILFVLGIVGTGIDQPQGGGLVGLIVAVAQAALAIVVLLVFGRVGLRRLLRRAARTDSPELFMAACLLVILGTGLATAAAGLSMAMGALIAGLLLAETEYRRQIEVTIEPFKGLLLGVFLIWVGMGLDVRRIIADPLPILALAVCLVALKFGLIYGLSRIFGLKKVTSLQSALLLAPGGEFGFVILGAALAGHLVSAADDGTALILAAITMATIPPLDQLGRALAKRLTVAPPAHLQVPVDMPDDHAPRVILAGFGRVGETVASMLEVHKIPYVAIDNSAEHVGRLRAAGKPVFWGDITRIEMLRNLHLGSARALVVTMSDHGAADRLVIAARRESPTLQIIVRARDARHAASLYALGATDAVPETIEASLQLSESVLVDLGIPMGPVIASIHEKRSEFQAQIKGMAPDADVRTRGRRRLRDARPV